MHIFKNLNTSLKLHCGDKITSTTIKNKCDRKSTGVGGENARLSTR